MRAEEAKRQTLNTLDDARKKNPALGGKIDEVKSIISAPDFCRVPVNAYGSSFREWQAKTEEACSTMLGRVNMAVASAVGAGDYDKIIQRLCGWNDGKADFETYYSNKNAKDGWGEPIMTSEIKNDMLKLISQTQDDINSYAELSRFFKGDKDKMVSTLQDVQDRLADTEIPNTQASYKLYSEIKFLLDSIRDAVAKGTIYDIDMNLQRLEVKTSSLIEKAQSGELTRSKAADNVTLGRYLNTKLVEPDTMNPEDLDELQAGIIVYNTLKQADSVIDSLAIDSARLKFPGPIKEDDDPRLRELNQQGRECTLRLQEAQKRGRQSEVNANFNMLKEIKATKQKRLNELERQRQSEYEQNKRLGDIYEEISDYLTRFKSAFVLQPGAYKLDLKKYKQYLAEVENNINILKRDEKKSLFNFKSNTVKITNIEDLRRLYQEALANNDQKTLNILKTSLQDVTDQQKVTKIRTDVETTQEKLPVRELTPEEKAAQEKEMADLMKEFGDLDTLGEFGGEGEGVGVKDKETAGGMQEQTPEDKEQEEQINQLIRELENGNNDF